jgi:protein-disulfide isomerase
MRFLTNSGLGLALGLVPAALAGQQAPRQAAPQQPPLVRAADQGRITGSDKAPLWLLVVSDFQCPYCKQWHDESWEAIRREFVVTGKIRVAYVNYPLGQHPNARPTAITAMCAGAQGKFWPVADRIFETQAAWKDLKDPTAFLDGIARGAGLDAAQMKACRASNDIGALIDGDQLRMNRAGTQSTPTFFIGRIKLEGAQPVAAFRRAIEAELAAARR